MELPAVKLIARGPQTPLTDNWLSNRIFLSYDDILDNCCAAWNRVVDQPWTIISIGRREWAHGF